MTKEQASQLIERLADKTQRQFKLENGETLYIQTRDCFIGDVLEKLQKEMPRYHSGEVAIYEQTIFNILGIWESVGTSKSLQTILEEAEWECDCDNSGIAPCVSCEQYGRKRDTLNLKSPTKELFGFLEQLFPA